MDAPLVECLKSLSEIRYQIRTLNLETELLREYPIEDGSELIKKFSSLRHHLESNKSIKRQFDYRSMIVSIYGSLEQFVDSLVAEFVDAARSIVPAYSDLPEPIRKHHVEVSIELISRVQNSKYRGDESVESIISRLYSCLSGAKEFNVNSVAFANHRANYRTEIIVSLFARIGIFNILKQGRNLPSFINNVARLFPDRKLEDLHDQAVYQMIDDLADRRNDVAHGNISDTLSHEMLEPYIDLVNATAVAIHEIAVSSLFPLYSLHLGSMESKPISVFNNEIICFTVHGITVHRGDLLIGWNQKRSQYIGGAIHEIEVNKCQVAFVDGKGAAVNAGFKVLFRPNKDYTYCVVPKERIV